MTETRSDASRRQWRAGRWQEGLRSLPEEVPVALSFNGTTQAVMMATPADLEDFAIGFSLTEGIARRDEIGGISVVDLGEGLDLQIWLEASAEARLIRRRRTMAGPVGCGLCGLESIAEALGRIAPVPTSDLVLAPGNVTQAMTGLRDGQILHGATRAAHAAAFFTPARGIVALREDIGRHNALDKLAGALAGAGMDGSSGAVLLTSRVSIDMVQKTAAIGAPMIIAASAPTAHAVRMAEAAGITLIALARTDEFEVFTHAQRITQSEAAHVA